MNKPKFVIYAFERDLSYAIIRVAVVRKDMKGNCVVVPVDNDGVFHNIPFDAWTVRSYEIYNTQKKALEALKQKVTCTLYNINEFLEHRIIDGSINQLHIPTNFPYPLSH